MGMKQMTGWVSTSGTHGSNLKSETRTGAKEGPKNNRNRTVAHMLLGGVGGLVRSLVNCVRLIREDCLRCSVVCVPISNLWRFEGTTNRRDRSHPTQCNTSREERQIVRMALTDRSVISRNVAQHIDFVTQHLESARTIRRRL
ncbi:hypothetical protein TNCV_5123141 [Trichonephila clavipes]|nr:hypothetical protein TNCV_5123141 [Trichonephila clavipes]